MADDTTDGSRTPPPRSVGHLAKLVLAYARRHGQSEKRTRDWISYMAVGGALERTGGRGVDAHFTLTGGVALELRRQGNARATKDLDLTYRGPVTPDVVNAVEEVLAIPYGRFTFQRTGRPLEMSRANTVRIDIKVRFDGSEWGTVVVDINRGEGTRTEIEMVNAFDLDRAFGIQGPTQLPCLSLRHHIAQKVHGMTRPPLNAGMPNERVQDAIDILLFREAFADGAARTALREACEEVFAARGTHDWPPDFEPPPHWRDEFTAMAMDLGIPVVSFGSATDELRDFIRDVLRVTP